MSRQPLVKVTGIGLKELLRAHVEPGDGELRIIFNGLILVAGRATPVLCEDGISYIVHDQKPSEAQVWLEHAKTVIE